MKNKKIVYILVPVTLLVWGMIFYKIFAGLHGSDAAPGFNNTGFVPAAADEIVSDTFSIHPDYRDPFLGKAPKAAVAAGFNANASAVKKTVTPPATTGSWPVIIYGGLIRNQQSNKQLVMLQVNGQMAAVKIGDVVNGVELNKVFKDSIEVKFGKEKRFVRK